MDIEVSRPTTARIRALQTQSLLTQVERAGLLDALSDALEPSESIAGIRRSFAISWVDLTVHDRISVAVEAQLGPAQNVRLWEDVFRASFEQPLLGGLVEMVRRTAGRDLRRLARHTNLVYQHLTRGCGTFALAEQKSATVLTMTGFPAPHDLGCWARSTLGFFRGVAASVSGDPERVQLHEIDDSTRRAEFRVA